MNQPPDVEIALAEPADAPALTEVQVRAFHDDAVRFGGAGAKEALGGPPGYDSVAWQLKMMKLGRYYAIRQAGRIVGGLIVFPLGGGAYNLGRIWIDPTSQGRGLGRFAIEHLHRSIPDARKWTLETPAWAVRNRHLYESLGYRQVGERQCPDGFTELLYQREPQPRPRLGGGRPVEAAEPTAESQVIDDPLAPEALTPDDRTRYAAAIAFAEERHHGQLRKGTSQRFAVHPLEAGALLAHHYPDRVALATAGFLHDTLEDTRTTRQELVDRFGEETARLVVAVTRRWWHAPWKLDARDPDIVRLKAADCVSNIRATVVDLRREGPSTWRRFSGGERAKRDYYCRLTRAISGAIPGEPLAVRLAQLAELLEAERPPARR